MQKAFLPVNFSDARGAIRDIFVDEPHEHVTVITTAAGGVRGNHYHKLSKQSDYLVSGLFDVYWQKLGSEKVEHAEWKQGELIRWEAEEIHEFIAREDSTFVTFVNGVRGGEAFEQDTFRIDVPLHEVFQKST